ncbi:elongation of very long chain fatty acids protein 4 [Zeugodacus cucurbitae]|uniref:Elongation of very long chain fatty acids protein n=1 Tax=Zeugodacus cucurbitae TaxID=28588 RepID=A0A0A1WIY9_ZEUCU|nr:elongation of very long chain fatty acids protein 4 [Zeugodacus cucurbitae]
MDVLQNANEVDYSYTSKELDEWFGLGTPTFIFATLLAYLLLIYKILPYYMKDREPYQLKSYIVVYNTMQMLSCIYIITGILRITSTSVFRFWVCTTLDSNTYTEYLFNRVTYFTFWLKISELSETIVFVLRKKQNQVSYLHVFHHCSTVTLIYLLLTDYRGLSALYPILLNSIVHVIMYAYYLAAAVCDAETIKRLTPIKKSITTIQMIQFVMILTQAFILVHCGISKFVVTYYAIVVVVIFYGFYDFYKKSYQANNARISNKSS